MFKILNFYIIWFFLSVDDNTQVYPVVWYYTEARRFKMYPDFPFS